MRRGEVRLKRVYENPSRDDGMRVLVDRLWPRGLSRIDAGADLWLKEVAPSPALRRGARAAARSTARPQGPAAARAGHAPFCRRDEAHNHAVVLRETLDERIEACPKR